jgi:hypothetical protein
MKAKSEATQYVVCVSNRGYAASLVVRRLFAAVDLPAAVAKRFAAAHWPAA